MIAACGRLNETMADEVLEALKRFYHEFAEFREDVTNEFAAVREEARAFRSEVLNHFDAMHKRFDRLESDAQRLASRI